MFEEDIFGPIYRAGVKFFIEFASANGVEGKLCPFPYTKCRNGKRLDFKGVKYHLETKGLDKTYTTWIFHGEKQDKQPVNIAMNIPVENVGNEQVREDVFLDFVPFFDAAFEVNCGVRIDDAGNEEPLYLDPNVQKRHTKYKKLVDKFYEEKRITQDSSVWMEAYTIFRRNITDKSPETRLSKWYGVINQIRDLNYTDFHETVFYCGWVKPVILAEEAKQVGYSKDLKKSDDWVAMPVPKRLTINVDDLNKPKPGSFQSVLEDEPHLTHLLEVHSNNMTRL